MVEKIIEYCARNRFMVFLAVTFALFGALYTIRNVKLDAIPDLSDPQVIIFTEWMGRSPTLVEDQITYPIVSSLVAAPHVTDVRGFSMIWLVQGLTTNTLDSVPGSRVQTVANEDRRSRVAGGREP